MSLSTNGNITIQDSTPVDVVYSEVQNTGLQSTYSDRTREIGVPRRAIVSHNDSGTGDAKRLRSLAKLTNCKENPSLEGDVVEHSIYVVYDTPMRIVEVEDVEDIQTQLINWISSANFVQKILNREA